MEGKEIETYEELKKEMIKTGEVGMLCRYSDLAKKMEKEGKITPEEAANIYLIYALRR